MKALLWSVSVLMIGKTTGLAQILYDGTAGVLPTGQGWSYAAIPGSASQTPTGSGVRLSTLALNAENAGYALVLSPPLERQTGFSLAFRFHLRHERHTREERAGFSVIVLGADRRGIELGFWQDGVFAQADQPLFTRGESAAFAFGDVPVDTVVVLRGNRYQLFAGGAPILAGPVRDYTAFTGFPDVYETPNFVFLGDNTTSAAAEVDLARIALVTPPVIALDESGAMVWTGVPGETYTVEGSPDLVNWSRLGPVFSATADFRWSPPADATAGFHRVTHP